MEEKKATEVECSVCKKGMSKPQIGMVIFSVYLLLAAIYGTVKIIQDLF
jgi:hypothetical protein